jgi:hypothetical protein
MIAKVMVDHELRRHMSRTACTKGIEGYTWGDAMEVSKRQAWKYSEIVLSDPL